MRERRIAASSETAAMTPTVSLLATSRLAVAVARISLAFCVVECFWLQLSVAAAAAAEASSYRQRYPYCRDLRSDCPLRRKDCTTAISKDTKRIQQWMHSHCPVTCRVCHIHSSVALVEANGATAATTATFSKHASSDVTAHVATLSDGVGRVLGVPQLLSGTARQKQAMMTVVQDSVDYYTNVVLKQDRYVTVRNLCRTHHAHCADYAVLGDACNKSAYTDEDDDIYTYDDMMAECAVICKRCHVLSEAAQCPYNPETMPNAWYPGDVNRMFERIVGGGEYSDEYDVTVLSRPANDNKEEEDSDSSLKDGPWVVVLDNFLSADECRRLIELGYDAGFERSYGMTIENGTLIADQVSDQRTSRNTWCDTPACKRDIHALAVRHRMANLTHISPMHSEPMQLLKYNVGEFYKTHHDYVPTEKYEFQGPRILTIFLYLSNVDEGGGTNFPMLNLTVEPRLGRALIWPSVHDAKPNDLDLRVLHQALPVIKGVKYGANVWLHQRDMQPASCRAEAGMTKTNDY